VLDNQNGYTCDVGDVENMSLKAIKLLKDERLYSQFSSRAYVHSKKYDINKIVPLYDHYYLKLIK